MSDSQQQLRKTKRSDSIVSMDKVSQKRVVLATLENGNVPQLGKPKPATETPLQTQTQQVQVVLTPTVKGFVGPGSFFRSFL